MTVYLNIVGPNADLEFLRGRPVVESAVAGFSSESRSSSSEFRIYAWKELLANVSFQAQSELRAKSFHLVRRKGAWSQWRRKVWIVDLNASRPTGRPVGYSQRADSSCAMVIVDREIEDDLWFHLRLLFSPYGIVSA